MSNRSILITGVGSGIGSATALHFHQLGWRVYGVDNTPPAVPTEFVTFLWGVLQNSETPRNIVEELRDKETHLDAVVNNAAIQLCKPLLETTPDEWNRVIAINLCAPYLMMQATYPLLRAAKGAVVNVASVHAVATSKNISAYAASKGGLTALTRAAAIEWAADGIRVNALLPGAVDTAMLRDGLTRFDTTEGKQDPEEQAKKRLNDLGKRTVMGRVGLAREMASAIYFLADGTQSGFMTGQTLVVDGGATARLSTE